MAIEYQQHNNNDSFHTNRHDARIYQAIAAGASSKTFGEPYTCQLIFVSFK